MYWRVRSTAFILRPEIMGMDKIVETAGKEASNYQFLERVLWFLQSQIRGTPKNREKGLHLQTLF